MGICGLYIHVPFCSAKCGYCDFFSVPPSRPGGTKALVDREIEELQSRLSDNTQGIDTLYVGGGTPTTLPEAEICRLLGTARAAAEANPREFTVEANPESLTESKAVVLASQGVDRISIGAQSFEGGELRVLERIHKPADTAVAVETARRSGIRCVSVDLIFGIPGQTPASWRESLNRTIDLGVEHVSCYGLTYEPGTRLTRCVDRGTVRPCDEGCEAEMYLQAIDTLTGAGFEHYEISSFARPGCPCEHNLTYWRNEPHIGVGPSAAGYVDGWRYRNVADLDEYIRMIDRTGRAEVESERLTAAALAGEMAMLGLRLIEGIDVAAVRRRSGVDIMTACAKTLERFAGWGLLDVSTDRVALTRDGLLVADTIISELLGQLDEHRSESN